MEVVATTLHGSFIMSSESVDRALESDAPLSAAVHQRDVAKEAAEAKSWHEAALVGRSVTINLPRSEVYAAWRDFKRFPQFMENVKSVTVSDDLRSHWSAGHTWKPSMEKQKREELYRLWKKAVTRSFDWTE